MGELLIWLVRVIIYSVILRFVMRLIFPARPVNGPRWQGGFRTTYGPRASAPPPSAAPMERAGGTLVRDPQCGTYIPESRAIAGAEGQHFCSAACRDAYAAARKAS